MQLSPTRSLTKSTLFPSRSLIHLFTQRAVNQVITTLQLLSYTPANSRTCQSSAELVTSSVFIVQISACTMADVNSTLTLASSQLGHHGHFSMLMEPITPQAHTPETVPLLKSTIAPFSLLSENGLVHTSPHTMSLLLTCTLHSQVQRKQAKTSMLLLRSWASTILTNTLTNLSSLIAPATTGIPLPSNWSSPTFKLVKLSESALPVTTRLQPTSKSSLFSTTPTSCLSFLHQDSQET